MSTVTPAASASSAEVIQAAVEELERRLSLRPLDCPACALVEAAGEPLFAVRGGRLERRPARGVQEYDARLSFLDLDTAAVFVNRVRDAAETNDLPRTVSSLMCELALPSWAGGPTGVQVSGAGALARLLWAAWLAHEQGQREKPRHTWADDDLSQGWVIVHSVSPGIRERVAVFQQELDRAAAGGAPAGAEQGPGSFARRHTAWLEELIGDLREAAEQFKETLAAQSGPGAEPIREAAPAAGAAAPPAPCGGSAPSCGGAAALARGGGPAPETPGPGGEVHAGDLAPGLPIGCQPVSSSASGLGASAAVPAGARDFL